MCKTWLSAYPKSAAGFELREIFCKIHFIDNEVKKQYWVKEFLDWSEKHHEFLNEKSYSQETGRFWYTHKMVRRCFSVIRKALPNMFAFLQNPNIPKTTNGIEFFFRSSERESQYSSGAYQKSKKKVYPMVSFLQKSKGVKGFFSHRAVPNNL